MKHKFGCLIVCRNEENWIDFSLNMIDRTSAITEVAIVRGLKSWRNDFTRLDSTDTIIKKFTNRKKRLDLNITYSELAEPISDENHRNVALQVLKDKGCDFVFILDCDEYYRETDLQILFQLADRSGPDKIGQVFCYAYSYWRGMSYRCGIERFGPVLIACRKDTKFNYIRNVDQDPGFTYDWLILHHMTAVKTDKQMHEKINGWSHSHEVVKNWWDNKWMRWMEDRSTQNLHPVSPALWPGTEKIIRAEIPAILHTHPWIQFDVVR